MFITGLANNPFTLLSKQAGEEVWEVNEDRCELLTESGGIADKEIDMRVEQQFNNALDRLAEWRLTKPPDCSLGGKEITFCYMYLFNMNTFVALLILAGNFCGVKFSQIQRFSYF